MLDSSNPDHVKSLEKCRNIKNEILNFGVNNDEILKLIELLSLELENTEIMRSINSILKPENISSDKKPDLIL